MNIQTDWATAPAVPQWTEIGQKTGLDPLAMLRPSEALYQSLLPGISTITIRLRYYSFLPWILDHYARSKRHTGRDVFRAFQRRAEVLYALVAMHGPAEPDGIHAETGVAGANWASRALKSGETVIDFAWGADIENSAGYLKNKGGALGGIYGPQLIEMGLTATLEQHSIPVIRDAARPLVKAVDEGLGDLASLFFSIVERGDVSLEELATLAPLKPSRINAQSQEAEELTNALFGLWDREAVTGQARRSSLLQLLHLAESSSAIPSSDDAKWAWYDAKAADVLIPSGRADLMASLALWRLYQMNDLLRLAYEAILKRALDVLMLAPRQEMMLSELIAHFLEDISGLDQDWSTWLDDRVHVSRKQMPERDLAHTIEAVGDPNGISNPESLEAAFSLIAILRHRAREVDDLIGSGLSAAAHFQSLKTETAYWLSLEGLSSRDALQRLIEDRVIKRHLWVASRKLRNQRAYTYLMEVAEGRLRYRNNLGVGLSSPRLTQALTFLEDVGLLSEEGLTDQGRNLMERL